MSQAQQASVHQIVDQLFADRLASLVAACNSIKAAREALIKALDEVIAPAIDTVLLHENCKHFNKITDAMDALLPQEQLRICMQIQDYMIKYLEIPATALIYAPAMGRFECNPGALCDWADATAWKQLIEDKPLSSWLKDQAQAKKPVKYGPDVVKKDLETVIKHIRAYGLETKRGYASLKTLIEDFLKD